MFSLLLNKSFKFILFSIAEYSRRANLELILTLPSIGVFFDKIHLLFIAFNNSVKSSSSNLPNKTELEDSQI